MHSSIVAETFSGPRLAHAKAFQSLESTTMHDALAIAHGDPVWRLASFLRENMHTLSRHFRHYTPGIRTAKIEYFIDGRFVTSIRNNRSFWPTSSTMLGEGCPNRRSSKGRVLAECTAIKCTKGCMRSRRVGMSAASHPR
jgi:hypothetical protein